LAQPVLRVPAKRRDLTLPPRYRAIRLRACAARRRWRACGSGGISIVTLP